MKEIGTKSEIILSYWKFGKCLYIGEIKRFDAKKIATDFRIATNNNEYKCKEIFRYGTKIYKTLSTLSEEEIRNLQGLSPSIIARPSTKCSSARWGSERRGGCMGKRELYI